MEKKVIYNIKSLDREIFRTIIGDNDPERTVKLTPTQMRIIKYILDNEGKDIRQNELEQVLNLRRATVSGVLQTMEINGLITRIVDNNDSRTKKIILAEKTKKIFNENKKKMDKLEKEIVKNISKQDLETFFMVIEKMKDNIRKYN